jgi:hypothetical protein
MMIVVLNAMQHMDVQPLIVISSTDVMEMIIMIMKMFRMTLKQIAVVNKTVVLHQSHL